MQRLLIEQAEHQNADNNYQTTITSVISVSKRAKSIFEKSSDVAGKRAFLKMLLQNPTVNGKELYFTIASPFNLVLQLATCPSWLPLVDAFRTLNWKKIKRDIEELRIFESLGRMKLQN